MTDRTKELIKDFAQKRRFDDVPSIIISLQEEDSVYEKLEFPNCFKRLRNMCAHEPANFVSQLSVATNRNCATVAFSSVVVGNFTMQMYQFTAWMFYMYAKTDQAEYIVFWDVLCQMLCPACVESKSKKIKLDFASAKDVQLWVQQFEKQLLEVNGKIRYFNSCDDYFNKIYREDRKLFLRMLIPNMMDIVTMLITKQIDPYNEDNIRGYLRLFMERDVS